MNKSNAHLYLPLVQALADGKLQIRVGERWIDISQDEGVCFIDEPSEYRRKPEPREWWIVEISATTRLAFNSRESACSFIADESRKLPKLTVVHVREVQE